MTKQEATIRLMAKQLAPSFDFDLPQWVIEGHLECALHALVAGLSESQEIAASGSFIGDRSFGYRPPEMQ
jgi:hypothetical protein